MITNILIFCYRLIYSLCINFNTFKFQSNNEDPLAGTPNASTANNPPQKEAPVELHPRKRKIKVLSLF